MDTKIRDSEDSPSWDCLDAFVEDAREIDPRRWESPGGYASLAAFVRRLADGLIAAAEVIDLQEMKIVALESHRERQDAWLETLIRGLTLEFPTREEEYERAKQAFRSPTGKVE